MKITPKGIVVHSMAEYIKTQEGPVYAHDWLKFIKLSVHGFIKPDGTYERMLETPEKASHAGVSFHDPYKGLNSHYLGFELLVAGEHDYGTFLKKIKEKGTYTKEQFETAVEVTLNWMKRYNIPADRVVRHSDVSGDDVRGEYKGKKDPGSAFDWDEFKKRITDGQNS